MRPASSRKHRATSSRGLGKIGNRPYLHRAVFCSGALRCYLKCTIKRFGFDDEVTAKKILRLGERSVGYNPLSIANANGRGTAR